MASIPPRTQIHNPDRLSELKGVYDPYHLDAETTILFIQIIGGMITKYNIKSRSSNVVADALSRVCETPEAQYFILSTPQFVFVD